MDDNLTEHAPSADERVATDAPTVSALGPWILAGGCLVWGVLLIARPTSSTSTLARLIGVGLILLGASFLVRAASSPRPPFDRVDGAAWSAVGVAALVWPGITVRDLAILIGVTLVATGLVELAGAVVGIADQRILLGIGALTSIGLGTAALAWPTATVLVLSVVAGARLIVAAGGLAARSLGRGRTAESPSRSGWRAGARTAVGAAGLIVAVLAATVSVVVHRGQPDEPGAFYTAPATLPGSPGTTIRSETIPGYVGGATTYRVLYVTSDTHGAPTTSSGLVIVPDGPAPAGGRPVMAFTHGTIGVARRCAPSLLPGELYAAAIAGLGEMLAAGFVVSATDYAGLGSDATTGYLIGADEAHSTLDGVRAAVAMPEAQASSTFVVFGESQGGHAALFAGEDAASYAPELHLAGVAAAAPATNLRALFEANAGTTFGDVLAAYALRSWAQVYGARLHEIVAPQALPVIDRLAELCLQTPAQMLAVVPEAELLKIRFVESPPWETEPWSTILADNTPGAVTIDAPVLIAQGAADPLVVPPVQRAFVDGWCASGQKIEYREYPGVGHLDAGHAAAHDVVEWSVARIHDEQWTPTCNAAG